MTNGIRFNYISRDAVNYKTWGSDDNTNSDELSVEAIESTDTDSPERSITEFLTEIHAASEQGWVVLRPIDKHSAIKANRLLS
jgi:hypothetical protein